MLGAGDPIAAGDLPEEFTGPLAYQDRWLWITLALAATLVLYYLAVWWFTRRPRVRVVAGPVSDARDLRAEHLARIDAVASAVAAGEATPRSGHQDLSEIVRTHAAEVSGLPARTMTLADLRTRAPGELVAAIELMYPPEFAPDEEHARLQFDAALARARDLVARWPVSSR